MSDNTEPQTDGETPEQQAMVWPLPTQPMPAVFDVVPQQIDGEPIVVIAMYTPTGAEFGWTTREGALALAKKIKQSANTGPAIVKQEAPSKNLIIPGGGAKN